jgi:hypothetical protein
MTQMSSATQNAAKANVVAAMTIRRIIELLLNPRGPSSRIV